MPDWINICIFIAVVIGVGCLFDSDKKTKNKLNDLLSGRPVRTDEDYHKLFFGETDVPCEVVSKVRSILSEQFGIDLSALEADDDFSEDYSLIWELDSMADVEIVMALEADFDIEISDAEAASIRSIRSIAEIVAKNLKAKNLG